LAARLGANGRLFVESEGLLLDQSVDRHLAMYAEVRRGRVSTV
jgi:hypothetical protein